MLGFGMSRKQDEENQRMQMQNQMGGQMGMGNQMMGNSQMGGNPQMGNPQMGGQMQNNQMIGNRNLGIDPDKRIQEISIELEDFKRRNPNSDIEAALKSPEFTDYVIFKGLSVEDAYLLTHKEEVYQKAQGDVINNLNSRKNRIVENGVGKSNAAMTNTNPKDLTDDEIDEINKRVARGEKIRF
ncbi:MAG: hypothetical protein RSC29_06315 [Oscillospiraceae bacterium]